MKRLSLHAQRMEKEAAFTAYLVTDESCSAGVGGRHGCAASALFPPWHRNSGALLPSAPGYRGEGGREGGAFSLSASQPSPRRLNIHFPIQNWCPDCSTVVHTGRVWWISLASPPTLMLSSSCSSLLWSHDATDLTSAPSSQVFISTHLCKLEGILRQIRKNQPSWPVIALTVPQTYHWLLLFKKKKIKRISLTKTEQRVSI